MNLKLVLGAAAAALVAGGSAFALSYGLAAAPSAADQPTANPTTAMTTTPQQAAPQRVKKAKRIEWAPCPQGTHLQHHKCVRVLVETVTVAAPAAPATQAPPSHAVAAAAHPSDDGRQQPAGSGAASGHDDGDGGGDEAGGESPGADDGGHENGEDSGEDAEDSGNYGNNGNNGNNNNGGND